MLGNVFTVLDRHARSWGAQRPAVVFDGEERTFGALRERALRVASALAGLGVAPGDRVGVFLPNGHEWTEIFFGTAALGAVCVPVNVLNSPAEALDVLEDADVSCLIAAAGADLGDEQRLPPIVLRVGGDYERLVERAAADVPPGPAPEDLFMIFYSSGTTGQPKGAAHTHAGILWNAFQQLPDFGLGPEDRYLAVPSLSWAAGFHNLILPLWWAGGTTVLLPTGGATVERIVDGVVDGGCTHTFLVPTLLKQLVAAPDQVARLRETGVRWIISGAEPVPVSVIEELNAELPGCDVVQGYGMSEFPTIATALRPEEAITKAGSAGRPMSITSLAVRGADGTITPTGEGEVLLRSLATMREYWRRPDQTREAFADGWLNTGDMGVVDEGGYLTITGRTKDLIISGGLNIHPKEIEDVIYRVPGVVEAAVVGVPDDRWGERVVAVVVAAPGRPVSAEAVHQACATLGRYKRPREVIVRTEPLPRTVTQKVLKRELRPWVAKRMAGATP